MEVKGYRGRFAPSPTGPLHEGSLVAALASWLDARAHGGKWLVRIEDVDTPRCVPGADQVILQQLAACGLHPDEPPVYQSRRGHLYQAALDTLITEGLAYPCACTRQDIALALAASGQTKQRHGELVYPGTCRHGLKGRPARAWRFLTETPRSSHAEVQWSDRLLGDQSQNVSREVGDFILKRADGLWAYQLAVVVDDAEQGITHVVRGEDLADNTARQILLQHAMGHTQPHYMHTPLVLAADGNKLSKQNGAQALMLESPATALQALKKAALVLHMEIQCNSIEDFFQAAVNQFCPNVL
jgi:glutamyl-Q tRNA(Asp) synthetase